MPARALEYPSGSSATIENVLRRTARAISRRLRNIRLMLSPTLPLQMLEASTVHSLYNLAYLLSGSEDHARDLVIEAFVNVARSPDWRRDRALPRISLFIALYNAFRQTAEHSKTGAGDQRDNDLRNRGLVRLLIDRQNPEVRCMIFLRHCESFSLSEIAEITGESAQSVRSQLLRFRMAAGWTNPTESEGPRESIPCRLPLIS